MKSQPRFRVDAPGRELDPIEIALDHVRAQPFGDLSLALSATDEVDSPSAERTSDTTAYREIEILP
jgi:hypothetical protein